MKQASSKPERFSDAVTRICLTIAFLGHFLVGAAYWWLSPKGFPLTHCRFWLNSVLPPVVMFIAFVGLFGLLRNRRMAANVALMFAAGWLGGAFAGRILFPQSLRGFWALGLMVGIAGVGLGWLLLRQQAFMPWRARILTPLCTLAGAFSVWAQLPPPASTQPLNVVAPEFEGALVQATATNLDLGGGSRFYPLEAELMLRHDKVRIRCSPLLSFDRVSPDRFWSLLAPRNSTQRRLLTSQTNESGVYRCTYNHDQAIELVRRNSNGPIICTAWTTIDETTYTHLNSYCVLVVEGHQNLSLSFSPCPNTQIEVLPADYPTGRPARMAYLTEQEEFRVVEASSGEKGPFHLLAAGPLRRGNPLSISLYNNDEFVGSLSLDDWSRQLSTDLSPTAGWRVPQNSIEFQRMRDDKNSPAHIYITLAATSVGRGWETVGHREGTYRNRIAFQPAPK